MKGVGAAIALLGVALVAACGGGGSGTSVATAGGTTTTASIASAQTGLRYDVDIWLPRGYSAFASPYPVVYATDCEYRFGPLSAVLEAADAQVILVNICAMGSERRWVDFTMPGAAAYYRFLTLELIPFVDAGYRTDKAHRILSGHSLSGEFVMYALYLESPTQRYFKSFIAADCSCWYDAARVYSQALALPLAMEQAMHDADPDLPVNLVMAGDTLSGGASNDVVVYNLIAGHHYTKLHASFVTTALGHVPMDGPSFDQALRFVLANP